MNKTKLYWFSQNLIEVYHFWEILLTYHWLKTWPSLWFCPSPEDETLVVMANMLTTDVISDMMYSRMLTQRAKAASEQYVCSAWAVCVPRVYFCVCACVRYPCHNCVSTQTSELWQMAGPSGIWTLNPAIVNASFHPQSWAEPVCRPGCDAAVCMCVCVSATSEPHSTDQWTSHCPSMVNNVLQSDRNDNWHVQTAMNE